MEFPTYEQMAKNVAEKALDEILYDGKSIREWMKIIGEQEQKTEWIPVSERMPTKTDYYLIQYSRKICHDEMAVAYYSVEEKESDPNYDWEFKPTCGDVKEVIAWMPLPEPYEPQERSDKE